jgi:hypothetical protein
MQNDPATLEDMLLPYDSAIVLLGVYPNKLKTVFTQKPAHRDS